MSEPSSGVKINIHGSVFVSPAAVGQALVEGITAGLERQRRIERAVAFVRENWGEIRAAQLEASLRRRAV